jgi:hypothetical protein
MQFKMGKLIQGGGDSENAIPGNSINERGIPAGVGTREEV